MDILQIVRRSPAVWAMAAVTLIVHVAFGARYDFFRNELYYVVCGRHPAFGYADQPPLVPLLAAATQMAGLNLWLLRLPGALAAAALVPLTAALAGLLGGGGGARVVAAAASVLAPGLIAMTAILTTSTFEPLAWTAFAYVLVRAQQDIGGGRALVWAGVVAGVALQAKYGIVFWGAGLLVGLLLTQGRVLLATRTLWVGAGLAVLIAAPSLVWQALHKWPFLGVMLHHAATKSNFTGTPPHFEAAQALAMNVVLTPLWIAGIAGPFVVGRLKAARFLAIGYVVTAALVMLGRGKDYYLFPAYPALFAVGAVALARLPAWLAGGWMTLAAANTALLTPLVLPILDPPALAAYLDRLHLHPPPDERAAVGAPLTQVFSDELGWRAMEKSVAATYLALPPEERKRAAIVASNYGEAAAIDVYGGADGLPAALSGQDQYWFWGPRGYDGSVLIHINGDPDHWRQNCASLDVVGSFGAPYVMPYEAGRPIFVCRGLRVGLEAAWGRFERLQ